MILLRILSFPPLYLPCFDAWCWWFIFSILKGTRDWALRKKSIRKILINNQRRQPSQRWAYSDTQETWKSLIGLDITKQASCLQLPNAGITSICHFTDRAISLGLNVEFYKTASFFKSKRLLKRLSVGRQDSLAGKNLKKKKKKALAVQAPHLTPGTHGGRK